MSSNQEQVPKLYDFLSVRNIDNIQRHFKEQKSSGLSYQKFRSLMDSFNIFYSDDAFHNVCLKIDLDRDNAINWSEFIAYFILELQNDDNMKERLSIIPPIPKPANVLMTTQRSKIARILLMSDKKSDADNSVYGCYVTIGSYGDLYFWSTNWKLEMISNADEIPETSSPTIELSDKRQIKKSSKTLLLNAVALMGLQIICISSVCSDLRFYDVSSTSKCNLRLYVRNFPSPLTSFHYHCSTDSDDKKSKLIFGDMVGSVRVIYFAESFKSQFRDGSVIRQLSYNELMKGKHEAITCEEFIKLHHDVIRQVSFIESMNSFVSASESIVSKSSYLPSVIIEGLGVQDTQIVFKMNNGTTCFAFDESSKTLATGGPDCILRLWNPIIPNSPKAILSGHTSGIIYIFMQDDGAKIYSMDKNKIIKIWDSIEEQLLQTFTGLKTIFVEEIPTAAFYDDSLRQLVVGLKKIATVKCQPRINLDITDGFTDLSSITVILLNKLYHFLVTCSVASTIIIWDVWRGRKVNFISRAHTQVKHGEVQLLEITAGCFDPNHQFLFTVGGETLKVWNFNEGICLRTIKIDTPCRVSKVFWTYQRIFAIGESVIEFNDNNDYKEQINLGKTWRECHQGDIVCASFRDPDAIVTSCTAGDLIFWHLETGQPYLRFNLQYPRHRLQVVRNKKTNEIRNERMPKGKRTMDKMKENKRYKGLGESHRLSDLKLPEKPKTTLTSKCMLSLNNRPLNVSNGTLLVSLSSGRIQVWSHHEATESCITDFDATHVAGDVITAMTTNTQNRYLFTGSAKGYIKAWMIINFCLSSSVVEKNSQVKLRNLFPFLWRDQTEGNAKIGVKSQLEPQLLNSYQGHRELITGLIFSEPNQVLISSSVDKSVRLWSLSGQYIGTIGSPIKWSPLPPNEAPPHDYAYRLPADLKHSVSYTTMKVLEGGNIPTLLTPKLNELQKLEKEKSEDIEAAESSEATRPFIRFMKKAVLKKDARKDTKLRYEKPTLDISLPHIPVYSHLRIHPTVAINLPRTIPKCLDTNNLPNLQYIFLEPEESKME